MKLFLICIILFEIVLMKCESCGKKCDTEQEEAESKYDKESNEIFKLVEEAVSRYKPCQQENCTCNIETLRSDFKPFRKTGITREMLDRIRDRGTKYQIIKGKLFRQKECMFPGRCSGIEYFIKKFVKHLPDTEMIINCRDYPQVNKHWIETGGPVLSFSKTDDYLDIMYPTWGFWEGGPAISLYPTGLGRWDLHRKSINKVADEKYPWEKKVNKGFFRGSRTSAERDPLVMLSRGKPDLVNAQYTKNQAWKSMADTLGAEPVKEISLEEHCRYKYLFNFRGVAASFRLKHLFLCKSLVFHVGDEWNEFFYGSLKPWVHYVPVKSNPTLEELEKLLRFFQNNDKLAREIAERGYQHIWNHLRMKDVECYWKKLLVRYAKLLNFQVVRDQNLIEI